MPLPKRPLGRTGMEVSVLGLGTVKLGRNQGVKYPQGFELPDDRAATQLLDQARELGFNLVDTAPAYGISEERLGQLLRGQREQWLICTKVGEEFVDGSSSFDFTPEHTRWSVERSLRRLATDRLDMVLVHSDGDDERIIRHCGTLEVLTALKAEGKIRAIGMSTKTVAGGLLAAETADCLMVTLNRKERSELPVIDRCRERGVGVLLKKALASGHAAGGAGDPVLESFRATITYPGVSSAVVGTINPDHLRANVKACLQALEESGEEHSPNSGKVLK